MVFLSYYPEARLRHRLVIFIYLKIVERHLSKYFCKYEGNNNNNKIDKGFVDDGCILNNMTATFPHVRGLSYLSLMYSSCTISSST